MDQSTMDCLTNLYWKLSPGGYTIIDDYGAVPACRTAVHEFRDRHGIEAPLQQIDWTGVTGRNRPQRIFPTTAVRPPVAVDQTLRDLVVESGPCTTVDVIVVNYRSYDELERCLTSLEPGRAQLGQVVIVDHQSDLEAASRITSRFSWVRLLSDRRTKGSRRRQPRGAPDRGAVLAAQPRLPRQLGSDRAHA